MLRAILDDVNGLPKELMEHYTERDGRYVLAVEAVEGYGLENTGGLRSALEKERQRAKELDKQAKELASRYDGLDADQARDALKKIAELGDDADVKTKVNAAIENERKEMARKIEAEKRDLMAKYETDVKALSSHRTKLEAALHDALLKRSAMEALAAEGGDVDLLLPHTLQHLRVAEEGDSFAVHVVNSEGTPRISTTPGSQGPMSVKELVAEMKADKRFLRAFEASGSSGSGGGRPNPTKTQPSMKDMSPAEKIKAGLRR